MATPRTLKSEKIVIVAIDFGTTYSGYAFAYRYDLDLGQPKVSAITWCPKDGNAAYIKTPTVLLLNPNQEFIAFGYDAEDKYRKLAFDGKHSEYYYFRRFKMHIHKAMVSSRVRSCFLSFLLLFLVVQVTLQLFWGIIRVLERFLY